MDFSPALPIFIITLREGVEAALIVGIVLAYLKKAKQTRLNVWVYAGIIIGILASALVAVLFSWIIQGLGSASKQYAPVIEPLIEGGFCVLAIILLSWMLIWMTQNARQLKVGVEETVGTALSHNYKAGWGIFILIFFAVLREGFEAVVFIAAKFQQGAIPTLGALLGLATAAGLGLLLFKWGIKINIRRFFQVMGLLLILIVAGLVVTALAHFDAAVSALAQMDRQSQSFCFYYQRFAKPQDRDCILGPMVWNTSKLLPDDRFPGIILNALFGYTQRLYLVQAVSYVFFLITVGGLYFQSLSGRVLSLPGKRKSA